MSNLSMPATDDGPHAVRWTCAIRSTRSSRRRVHQDLLNRLNLDRLTRVTREDAEPEIRGLIVGHARTETARDAAQPLRARGADRRRPQRAVRPRPARAAAAATRPSPTSSSTVTTRSTSSANGKLEETDVVFNDDEHLMQIIERIVSAVGRRIDESSPMVDARLPDGSRVNAIIPPLALDGPALSIRRFRTDRLGAQDLVERDSLTQPMLDFLKAAVGARLNILVSGGTGAGKTTLLNVLSSFISDDERIVTIEDAAELMLRQRHVVRLETRPANIEGKGAVRQRELVINALRMRPDRIIVGEVRGEEALDMLQAMNTGHDGSLTTIHANSPARRAVSPRHDGGDGEPQHSGQGDPPADRVGGQPRGPGHAHVGRHAPGDGDRRDHRHGGRGDHDAGDLRVRANRDRRRTAVSSGGSGPPASGRSAARSSPRRASAAGRHVRARQAGRHEESHMVYVARDLRRRPRRWCWRFHWVVIAASRGARAEQAAQAAAHVAGTSGRRSASTSSSRPRS